MTIPYLNYKEITSKQELEGYIEEIENGLLMAFLSIYQVPLIKTMP